MSAPVVLLTRAPVDNAPLAQRLAAEGLCPQDYPCVAIAPISPDPGTVARLREGGPVDAIAFASRRGVEGLAAAAPALRGLGLHREDVVVGAVGEATARSARQAGWHAPIVPEHSNGAALAERLAERLLPGARVLLPCGDRPRPELPEGLRRRGLAPLPLQVYAHRPVHLAPVDRPPAVAVVASPSAAETLCAANPGATTWAFVAIGPTTGAALRRLGARDITVAASPRTHHLAAAVRTRLQAAGTAPPEALRSGPGGAHDPATSNRTREPSP